MIYSLQTRKKLTTYFTKHFRLRPENRNGWMGGATCPYCDKPKMGIHPSTGRANCFYCEVPRNMAEVVMHVEKLQTWPELLNYIQAFEGTEFLSVEPIHTKLNKPILPESFTLLSLGKSYMGKLARDYMMGRGFNVNKLTMRGIGYCTNGDYMGCIILPFYQAGQLIYFTARRFVNLSGQKFKNPSLDDFGIGKSMIMYNCDSLVTYNKVYIVESVTNALTLGLNAIALGGKVISEYQLSLIVRSPVKRLTIVLDNDAHTRAIEIGMKLANFKKIKIINPPDERDVNDLGRKPIVKWEKEAPLLGYQDIYKMYLTTNAKNPINSYLQ